MLHNQPAIIQDVQYGQNTTKDMRLEASEAVTVKVINTLGNNVDTYEISGNQNEVVGNQVKDVNNIVEVLVNGEVSTMNQLKEMKIANIHSVTIVTQEGVAINTNYNVNGHNYTLASNIDNRISLTEAKIYVPKSVQVKGNITSVSIDGVNYSGKLENNFYIVKTVKGDTIPAVASSHNVTINIHNSKGANYGKTTTTKANVDFMVINQFGQTIEENQVDNTNGMGLLPYISKACNNKVLSIKYNGQNVTLMDILTQQYVAGTDNMLVVTVYTQPQITEMANLFGRSISLPSFSTNMINANGANLELPTGLARNFNVQSVTINGIEYKGKMDGTHYVVNEFIPSAVQYMVKFNLQRHTN